MYNGFVRVASITPKLKLADVKENTKNIINDMKAAFKEGAEVIVFPELCITGYTLGDLFYQDALLDAALLGLKEIVEETEDHFGIVFVGLPFLHGSKLYNVAAAISQGSLLGLVPKINLPNYSEFYEARQFNPGKLKVEEIKLFGEKIPFGAGQLFACEGDERLMIGAELCEDLWVPEPPSIALAKSGASLIANLSASNELVGKDDYRRMLVSTQSARLYCGYIYASASMSESTTDVVYSGARIIAEGGRVLSEDQLFSEGILYADIDLDALRARRRLMSTFDVNLNGEYTYKEFALKENEIKLNRKVDDAPFVPKEESSLFKRCERILDIQSWGLARRLSHTNAATAVIGISGGLDSTLALIVAALAFDKLGRSRSDIIAVTMPGFGTTGRTYQNATELVRRLGATLREIPIREACLQHFADIGQDPEKHDVTYENTQARERTQILMDLANMENALVVGTGDLSELALGWCTYNGDHMSMYGVNGGVPKTLAKYIIAAYGEMHPEAAPVLTAILDTPISPELLPAEYQALAERFTAPRAVCDYIAGMSDDYAIWDYEKLFIPRSWDVR